MGPEGMDPSGQHRHRAQHLGRQGQELRGREPVLPGEDGVHSWRTQKHLQGEGETCRESVTTCLDCCVHKTMLHASCKIRRLGGQKRKSTEKNNKKKNGC